jgi:hypothetical protein
MTIRPTSLNVSSDCDPLKVICKAFGQEAENDTVTESVIYKIASELLSTSNRIRLIKITTTLSTTGLVICKPDHV